MEAHAAVLASMMIKPECVQEVLESIKPEMFPDFRHREIFNAISQVEEVSPITVRDRLKFNGVLDEIGGAHYVVEVSETVVHAAGIKHHIEDVIEAHRRSLVRDFSKRVAEVASTNKDALEQRTDIENELRKLDFEDTVEVEHIGEIAKGVKFGFNPEECLQTGYKSIDDVITGIYKADYIVISGRPSMGKTSLMCGIISNMSWTRKIPTSLYSLEMTPKQIVKRMCSARCEVPLFRVENPNAIELPYDKEKLMEAAGQLEDCPMYIKAAAGLTPSKLKRMIKADIRRYGIKCAFVDHLHLMKPDKGNGDSYQDLSTISRSIKHIILETGIPIVMGCQLKRVEKASKPSLQDIRGTGAIEEDADVIMGIHRPSYWEDYSDSEAYVYVMKGKHHGPGMAELEFNGELTTFREKSLDF